MAVKAIKYGMKGNDVANLQETLNKLGYSLTVDGSFGPKTLAAVKDYQRTNNLADDGMVGPQTQSVLFGGSSTSGATSQAATTPTPATTTPAATTPATTTPPTTTTPATTPTTTPTTTPPTTTSGSGNEATGNTNTGFTYNPYKSSGAVAKATETPFSYDNFTYDDYQSSGEVAQATEKPFSYDNFSYDNFSYGDYQESETVKQASAALDAALAAQPGAYQSKWADQVNSIIDKILNRESFSYNFNEDPLYKMYAEQYERRGKMAMQDTMGQAAAMTGGYGNSYASTAGNQAYQEYLSQLNEVIPELRQMALNEYNMEGQELYNQYGLLSSQEQQEYGRYMDSYNQWLAERDYATGRYDSERNFDYGKYADDRNFAYNQYVNDRNYEYGKYSDDRNLAYDQYVNAIDLAKWQETDEYNKYLNDRNLAYDAYSADKQYAYNDYLTGIDNAKWTEEMEYKRYLDSLGIAYDEHINGIDNAYRDQVYADSLVQQEKDNAYRDQVYSDTLAQQEKDNAYRETTRQDAIDSENKAYAREEVLAIMANGGTPNEQQLKIAGLTKETAEAMVAISSGDEKAALEHVASMSSAEIVDAMQVYSENGDNTGLAAFLDDCVTTGRLTEEQADAYYEKYVTNNGHTITDTTVPKSSGGNVTSSKGSSSLRSNYIN